MTPRLGLACLRLLGPLGESEADVPLWACSVFSRCTLLKPVEDVACCKDCDRREPPSPPTHPTLDDA